MCLCASLLVCFFNALVAEPEIPQAAESGTDPLLVPFRGNAATHTHTHLHVQDPETHFDLRHLVWSARPRAWQLMINISPRPLPSLPRVHANTQSSVEMRLLLCACTVHAVLRSELRGPACWLDLWTRALTPCHHHKGTSGLPQPLTPHHLRLLVLLSRYFHITFRDCRLLSAWLTRSKKKKKVDHLISEDFLGGKRIFLQLLGFVIDLRNRRFARMSPSIVGGGQGKVGRILLLAHHTWH